MTSTGDLDRIGSRPSPISIEANQKLLAERAHLLAAKPQVEDKTEEELELTSFQLGESIYAFESKAIREICAIKTITPLPCTPNYIDGLIYLRGQIIALIDLQKYLSIPTSPLMAESKAILADSKDLLVGFRVDRVLDAILVKHSALDKSRKGLAHLDMKYVLGIVEDSIVVLDLKTIVTDQQLIVNQTI